MIRNHFRIAWRNLYKHKFYTCINVLGLAVAISCTVMLFLFINYHLSFDRYHPNSQRIYRLVTDLHIPDGSVDYDQGTPLILGHTLLQQDAAVVKEGVFLKKRSFTVSIQQESSKPRLFYENENIAFANTDLFSIFSSRWLQGDSRIALNQPNTAVITAGLARKYFGTDDATGKIIRLENKYNITITGVLADNRKPSDVQADLYISLASVKGMYPDTQDPLYHDWTFISSKNNVFVLLNTPAAAGEVNRNIENIIRKALPGQHALQFHLQPLTDVHFDSRYSGTISKSLLMVLALIGVALLIIAGVNFVNMATAQSLTRSKEIGTRKVLGSSAKDIFWQFMAETACVALAAAVFALWITLLLLPTLNTWLQLHLTINADVFMFMAVLVVALTFLAGFYPGVILSRFKPVNALKNIVSTTAPLSTLPRSVLIVVQNTIAQLLIVCSLIITVQINFMKNADMGFNKDAVIMVPVQDTTRSSLTYLRHQLTALSGVKSASLCYSGPAAVTNKGGSVRYDNKDWEKFTVNSIIGDESYLKTFGLTLLTGRNLSTADTTAEYLINEKLVAQLGIKTPEQAIGHTLIAGDFNDRKGTIVGVVKNFNTRPLYSAVEPTLIAANPEYYTYAAVKISGNHQLNTIRSIERTWQHVYPQYVFNYHFFDQQVADFYAKEETISKLIKAGTAVAILISCLGFIGLISLVIVQRTKEIGIRKVLGASAANITALLSRDFVKLIAVAILISMPAAWLTMHHWLQGFAYRVTLSWWILGSAALIALSIALLTICLQAFRAALMNPVNSIRNQ